MKFRDKYDSLTPKGIKDLTEAGNKIRKILDGLVEEGYTPSDVVAEIVQDISGWKALMHIKNKVNRVRETQKEKGS